MSSKTQDDIFNINHFKKEKLTASKLEVALLRIMWEGSEIHHTRSEQSYPEDEKTNKQIKNNNRRLPSYHIMPSGNLSNDVFERRTSTGSGRFADLRRDFDQVLGQIVSMKTHLGIQIWQRGGILEGKRTHFRLTCVT